MTTDELTKKFVDAPAPLTRDDIADILASIGPHGQNRETKIEVIKRLCDEKPGNQGYGHGGHPVWETLEDWPEF